MENELINKIKNFFKQENYGVEAIFENKEEDYEYYVIYTGPEKSVDIVLNDKAYDNLIGFQRENQLHILGFYLKKGDTSKEKLTKEFQREGYKKIFEER